MIVRKTDYRSNAHAVIIGIDHYQDDDIANLSYACADAEAVYDVLVDPHLGRFHPSNIELLLDENASERKIKTAIATQLSKLASRDDTVFIYFAGHGAPVIIPRTKRSDGFEKYIIPSDGELDNLRASGIPMEDVKKYFGWIDSRQVLFFIDSCYSGTVEIGGRTFSQPDYEPRATLTDDFLDDLASEGRCVVTACGINEVSIESSKIGHGLFTYYLIEGLKGAADADNDRRVSVQELYRYLYDNVSKHARSLNGCMNPSMNGSVQGHVYLTNYESVTERKIRELLEEAEENLRTERVDVACRSWAKVLHLDEKNEAALLALNRLYVKQLMSPKRLESPHESTVRMYREGIISELQYLQGISLVEDPDGTGFTQFLSTL